MKRMRPALLFALLAAAFAACAPQTPRVPEPTAARNTPVQTVADAAGLPMAIDAPEGAENVRYSIVSGGIAQVDFTLDGCAYTYRAANAEGDVSGVRETFDDEERGVEVDGVDWSASIRIRTIHGGKDGALATWRYGAAQYALYTGDAMDADTISTLACALAETVCPRTEVAGETLSPLFDLRAAVDDGVKTALYDYFRGVCYGEDWFDARAAEGVKIRVYAARAYGTGMLAVADFYVGGELAPDLCYIEDGAVQSATSGSDCWAINYTRMNGDTIVYGKSFAWDGAPVATTHAVAVFSDGTAETVEMWGEQGGDQPGFLFIGSKEVWLDTLTLYDGETAVADQDSGQFTVSEAKDRFAQNAPLCQWTRFQPMLDAAARERRFREAASSVMQLVRAGDEGAGLLRWHKDSGAVFPDLWRTLGNGLPAAVVSDQPLLLDGLNREDANALYWVELALDDGTPAGIEAAVQRGGAGLDSRASGGGDAGLLWSTPGAPGHDGLYLLILEYDDCWYTALFNVERGK